MDLKQFDKDIRAKSFAYSIDGMEPDDIYQELWIALFKAKDRYDPEKSSERTFANHVLNNRLKNILRSVNRHNKRQPIEYRDNMDEITDYNKDPIPYSYENLTKKQAEIVRLKTEDCLTFKRIATNLEISISTVKTHYYRGVNKLKAK